MRILVFSDSHGEISVCEKLINKISGTKMIVHAGDCASDARKLEALFPEITVKYVRGNCDFTSGVEEQDFVADGKKFFLAHGHKYAVKYDYDYRTFENKVNSLNADIGVFGHTHVPYYNNTGKIILLNPGSIKYGRTFGIIEIEDGRLKADICDANNWI